MEYCEITTTTHPVAQEYPTLLESLDKIFKEEGCNQLLFDEIKAINLDKVEIERCKKSKANQQPTMDFTIGIKQKQQTEIKKANMLLVELKLRVKKPTSLTKEDIENKINHSINILSQDPAIHPQKIFIFTDKQTLQAARYISQLYLNRRCPVIVQSAEEFKQKYFSF